MRGDIIYERGEHSLVNIVSGVDIIHRGKHYSLLQGVKSHGKMSLVSAPGSVFIKTERMFRQPKFLEPLYTSKMF